MRKKYYQIRPLEDEHGCWFEESTFIEGLKDWLDSANEGTELAVKIETMDEEDFIKMSEYEG